MLSKTHQMNIDCVMFVSEAVEMKSPFSPEGLVDVVFLQW